MKNSSPAADLSRAARHARAIVGYYTEQTDAHVLVVMESRGFSVVDTDAALDELVAAGLIRETLMDVGAGRPSLMAYVAA